MARDYETLRMMIQRTKSTSLIAFCTGFMLPLSINQAAHAHECSPPSASDDSSWPSFCPPSEDDRPRGPAATARPNRGDWMWTRMNVYPGQSLQLSINFGITLGRPAVSHDVYARVFCNVIADGISQGRNFYYPVQTHPTEGGPDAFVFRQEVEVDESCVPGKAMFVDYFWGVSGFGFSSSLPKILGTVVTKEQYDRQKSEHARAMKGGEESNTYVGHALGSYSVIDFGPPENEDRFVVMIHKPEEVRLDGQGNDVVLVFPNGDQVRLKGQRHPVEYHGVEKIVFLGGEVWDREDILRKVIEQAIPTGVATGSSSPETYSFNRGDSSYIIQDFGDPRYTDTLNLHDVDPLSVKVEGFGADLVFTYPDGESVRVIEQRNVPTHNGVELVNFDDGTQWDREKLVELAIEEGMRSGHAEGSKMPETYVIEGDTGSFLLHDYGRTNAKDVIVYRSVAPDEIEVRAENNDVILKAPSGSEIRIQDQRRDPDMFGVEEIRFNDESTWNRQELLDEVIRQAIPTGSVQGSAWGENYVVTRATESLSIWDWGRPSRKDTLHLNEHGRSDVEITRDAGDVILRASPSMEIRIHRQLHSPQYYGIERIVFSDGETLIRDEIHEALKAP